MPAAAVQKAAGGWPPEGLQPVTTIRRTSMRKFELAEEKTG